MKPLDELDEFSSESERRLADLFATVEKYRPNPLEKRRIHVRIEASRRHRIRVLQPGVVAALLCAGTAAAALGHRLWNDTPTSDTTLDEPSETAVQVAAPPLGKRASVETPKPAPAPEEIAAPENTGPAPALSPPALSPPVVPAAARQPKPVRAASAVAVGEDPTRVAEALRALRREGDAARAQALLSDYLKANPRGALAEEALALAVEAAHARHDPKAQSYARRYLEHYPRGRHAPLARRVLAE